MRAKQAAQFLAGLVATFLFLLCFEVGKDFHVIGNVGSALIGKPIMDELLGRDTPKDV